MDPHLMNVLYRSALAIWRAGGVATNPREIRDTLVYRFGLDPRAVNAEVYRIVASAESNWRQATVLGADPNAAIPIRSVPIDPTINPDAARFQYRVVVVSTDGSGNVSENLVTVTSLFSLSGNEVIARAEADVQAHVVPRGTNPKDRDDGGPYTFESHIVSAGQARR